MAPAATDGDNDATVPSSSSSHSNKNMKKKVFKGEYKSKATASCCFPMSRVRRLVRGGEAGHTADSRASHDTVFLINMASEMFLHGMAEDAFGNAVRARRRSIGYHHISSIVSRGKRCEFLSDFVPEQVKAEDALKARALVET